MDDSTARFPRRADASLDAPPSTSSTDDSRRHAIRHRPPLHPPDIPSSPDPDQLRRRALSEVVRADLPGGKWRVVSAWSSLRRSLDASSKAARADDVADAAHHGAQPQPPTLAIPSRITSERRDSTLASERPSTASGRKRVSLFLRRRRTASPAPAAEESSELVLEPGEVYEADEADEEDRARAYFRRAQSGLVKPVSLAGKTGGEGGRYLQYAAEVDDDSFERLRDIAKETGRKFVRPGAIRIVKTPFAGDGLGSVEEGGVVERDVEVFEEFVEGVGGGGSRDAHSDEIVGEICLEDFADVGSEDFDFLENQSVDLTGLEPSSLGRLSRGTSLNLDSQKLRWVGNEAEFAVFFAGVGLDEWFDVEGPREVGEFEVSEETAREWELAAEEHNERCELWGSKAIRRVVDIRQFERDFRDGRRRRGRSKAQAAAAG